MNRSMVFPKNDYFAHILNCGNLRTKRALFLSFPPASVHACGHHFPGIVAIYLTLHPPAKDEGGKWGYRRNTEETVCKESTQKILSKTGFFVTHMLRPIGAMSMVGSA